MTTKNRRLIQNAIIQMFIFAITFVISKIYFEGVYVFEWTSNKYYLYLWIVALLLTCLNKKHISYAITIANTIGLFIGQYIGDYIKALNQYKITATMSNEDIYRLSKHYGVFIWMGCVILSIFLGVLINFLNKQKRNR